MIVSTGLAIYILVSSSSLSLPISLWTTIATILLPILSVTNVFYTPLFQRSPQLAKYPFAIQLGPAALHILQGALTVILATLYFEGFQPGRYLDCNLQETWKQLWMAHNGRAIGRIQDAFSCCGFRSERHMSWPPSQSSSKGSQSLCSEMNHRTISCADPWRSAMQVGSGLGFAVAALTGIFQLIFLIRERRLNFGRSRPSLMRITQSGDEDADDEALLTHDESSPGAAPRDGTRQVRGYGALGNGPNNPRIEPSGLGNERREWYNESNNP